MTIQNFNVNLSLSGMIIRESKTIPQIKIYSNQIPLTTKTLHLVLEDITFHNCPFGTTLLPYEGVDIILNNSFKLIIPLSPPFGSHNYQLTVRALDENHQTVGIGQTINQFPG